MKRNEVIEFDFNHHSILEIVGETKGAIQFNEFEILSCQSMPGRDGTTTTTAGSLLGSATTTTATTTTTISASTCTPATTSLLRVNSYNTTGKKNRENQQKYGQGLFVFRVLSAWIKGEYIRCLEIIGALLMVDLCKSLHVATKTCKNKQGYSNEWGPLFLA